MGGGNGGNSGVQYLLSTQSPAPQHTIRKTKTQYKSINKEIMALNIHWYSFSHLIIFGDPSLHFLSISWAGHETDDGYLWKEGGLAGGGMADQGIT